jgi:branched-chain amino acid transport system substrate-binding protein
MTGRASPGADGTASPVPSPTRAFLFADLRGYTQYVEAHGAARASELVDRYRALVRSAVERARGAEVKTEGDSFLVVFDSVSSAVQCGLSIQEAAAGASLDRPEAPIRVGIGIHAGETVATDEGYIGSAVNVAARLCALAKAGEVLVTDTVRSLTATIVAVRFESRGRQRLKGVPESVAVFAVLPVAEADDAWAAGIRTATARRTRRRRAIALVAGVGVVAGAVALGAVAMRPAQALPPGPWKIGLDLPLSGRDEDLGRGIAQAVELALDEVNEQGGIGGARFEIDARDHGADNEFGFSVDQGAANAAALVADPRVVAMIGPTGSFVAERQIPITNEAGLFQCSPATTFPGLTKPRFGALDLRHARPDQVSYVRLAPSDDIQAYALASFAFRDLGLSNLLVIDDADLGRGFADEVSEAYVELGGDISRRTLNPGADPTTVLDLVLDDPEPPDGIVFGGFVPTGAADVRLALVDAGYGSIPFLSWDGLLDGSGAEPGSYLEAAGPSAVGTYVSHASMAPPKFSFTDQYRSSFGAEPHEYAVAAYGCAEVILQTLRAVADEGASADALREAVRAHAVDVSHRYETVLGSLGFDSNGDSTQQFVTFYRVDPLAAGGKGDWVIEKQHDYGPAP